jgi:hypothetical protein
MAGSALAMGINDSLQNLLNAGPLLKEASASGNLAVLRSLLGPAWRGLVQQRGKGAAASQLTSAHPVHFDWTYRRDRPEMRRLYEAAKVNQWNATKDLDWATQVDLESPNARLVPDDFLPFATLPSWKTKTRAEQERLRRDLTAWLLSQFLHGEQGALFAATQVTEAVPWLDGKLYGASQVMDEGRHVEVFHGYLTQKLEKLYEINDNLYVVIDALVGDSRWDMKFLGMQIMIEGLALGAFGMLRQLTAEPLLKQLLTYVISDEARHVHYGVLALEEHVKSLSEKERREREDWTFEVSLLLRSRFLAHEFYEEHYAHELSRKEWNALVMDSNMMALFRRTMFKRIIPNLKRIGLLSDRVRPLYSELGLLEYEGGRAAPELTAKDLIEDR